VARTVSAVAFLSIVALSALGQVRMLWPGNGVVVSAVLVPYVVTELPPPGTPWVVVFCPGPLDDEIDRRPRQIVQRIFWQRERPIRWPAAFRRAEQKQARASRSRPAEPAAVLPWTIHQEPAHGTF
jgi:hypothetical protein